MENGDLKRYYKVNNQEAKDFARLNADGKIDKDLLPEDVGTTVVANPTGTATDDLTKIQVGETIYGIPEGTEVVANPTLAGTEAALNGLQVGETKYKLNYLPLSGGALTGDLQLTNSNGAFIRDRTANMIIGKDGTKTYIGSGVGESGSSVALNIDTNANAKAVVRRGSNEYEILTTNNGLALTGGTMTGPINIDTSSTSIAIRANNSKIAMACYVGGVQLGDTTTYLTLATDASRHVQHYDGTSYYSMLDTKNTQANPTLSGTETALTSLKLNGTNYSVGGTQVTFVDWS